jgi:hypothetical protein
LGPVSEVHNVVPKVLTQADIQELMRNHLELGFSACMCGICRVSDKEIEFMADDWKDYQEEAAEFFRSLGLKSSTDVTMEGVRTKHDVDVLVEIDIAGLSVVQPQSYVPIFARVSGAGGRMFSA